MDSDWTEYSPEIFDDAFIRNGQTFLVRENFKLKTHPICSYLVNTVKK